MKGKAEEELERLQKQGIIEPILFSSWVAAIVWVMKPDGSVWVCQPGLQTGRLPIDMGGGPVRYPERE